MPVQRCRLLIQGRVQGVFYRVSAQSEARRLSLVGWVRNLPSGEVEALVEGEPEALDSFIAWCRRGPPGARVGDVLVEKSQNGEELRGFSITG